MDKKSVDGKQETANIIVGRNPVIEALKSDSEIEKLIILKDAEGSIKKIIGMAKEKKIPYSLAERAVIDRECQGNKGHQGVIAVVAEHKYYELDEIIAAAEAKGEDPFIIILDGIEDPHNLGAIMRTADAAGAHGIVIPKRRAVGLTSTVAKASAGAIEYVPVARVPNIGMAIDELKEKGLWIGSVDMDGKKYCEADLKGKIGLVIGGEGSGISRLVKEKCDFSISIPMMGKVSSLNASNAAAVVMYEVCRQRQVI